MGKSYNDNKGKMMKKITLLFIGCVICNIISAQSPSPIGEARGGALSLQQVLDSARANNIAMRNAGRDIASAQEQRKEAYTKYFPTVSGAGGWFNSAKALVSADVNVGASLTSSITTALSQTLPAEAIAALNNPISIRLVKDGVIGGLTAIQPVYAGGRIVNSNKLAKVGEDASRLQLRLSQNDVDKTAEGYFWSMVAIEEKLKTVAAVERLLNDIHKDVDVSVRAGVALRNDLLQVELRQNNVESQKLKLNNGLSLVKMLLAQYCGLQDTTFLLSYDSEAASPISLRQDHQSALPQTAEYQLLGKQVESAKLQKKLAVGEYMPSVGVGAGYSYNNVLGNGKSNGTIFATLQVPISDWWGGSHAIKRKKIAYQKAVDERQDKAELLVIRMQNAWNNVEEAYKQLNIAEKSIEQSDENLRIHRDHYNAGTATMSDLLEAQLLYQQSQDQRTDAFADYQNSILEYKQAVGQ